MLRDEIDRQIIACLTQDARLPYPAIGEQEVGLSAPAVKRRIDRLRADGTITGFTVTLDPAEVGETTEAFVEVHCQGRTSPEQIRQLALRQPTVVAAYTVTGQGRRPLPRALRRQPRASKPAWKRASGPTMPSNAPPA